MLSIFLPVIKPGMENEFLSIWKKWFVTEDTVDDEKFPGKLKSRVFYLLGLMYQIIQLNGKLEMELLSLSVTKCTRDLTKKLEK